jgi:hypothetical protein
MGNPDFDEEVSRPQVHARRSRRRRFLVIAFAAFLGSYLLGFPGCSRSPYTCAVCRKGKVDKTCMGLKWSDQEETDCSRWYRSNVEQTHTHFWVRCTVCRPLLFGGYSCIIGGPITGLSRTVQINIYKHFVDQFEAKQLFIDLGKMEGDSYRTWNVLMEWVNEDFPGTWHDWWEKHPESAVTWATAIDRPQHESCPPRRSGRPARRKTP